MFYMLLSTFLEKYYVLNTFSVCYFVVYRTTVTDDSTCHYTTVIAVDMFQDQICSILLILLAMFYFCVIYSQYGQQ